MCSVRATAAGTVPADSEARQGFELCGLCHREMPDYVESVGKRPLQYDPGICAVASQMAQSSCLIAALRIVTWGCGKRLRRVNLWLNSVKEYFDVNNLT
jgi:hypothetical protein